MIKYQPKQSPLETINQIVKSQEKNLSDKVSNEVGKKRGEVGQIKLASVSPPFKNLANKKNIQVFQSA